MSKKVGNKKKVLLILGVGFCALILIILIINIKFDNGISFNLNRGEKIAIIFSLIGGLADWIALCQKEKTTPSTHIKVSGGSPQIATGEKGRNIQTTTYNENVNSE